MGQRSEEPLKLRGLQLVALLLLLGLGSADEAAEEPKHRVPFWAIFIVLDSRGELQSAGQQIQQQWQAIARQNGWPLGVLRFTEEKTANQSLIRQKTAYFDKNRWQEVSAGRVARMGAWAAQSAREFFARRPAQHRLLVLVGHGRGLLEREEDSQALEPAEVAHRWAALSPGREPLLDIVSLESCYSGAWERLWEWRTLTHYIIAAPGLIYQPGLRWASVWPPQGEPLAPAEVVRRVTRGGMARAREAALVAVETGKMPAAMEAWRRLAEQLRRQLPEVGPIVAYVRSRTASWGKRQELCDVGGFLGLLPECLPAAQQSVVQQAQSAQQALREAILAQWPASEGRDRQEAGLGVYFPRTVERLPEKYGSWTFARESSWQEFLQAYTEWMLSLLAGSGLSP